jgi:hypothetical protein
LISNFIPLKSEKILCIIIHVLKCIVT